MAYSWCANEIKQRYNGEYDRLITYTMVTEEGTSLLSLGDWEIEFTQPYSSGWNRSNRPRSQKKTDGIPKHRWIKYLYDKPERIFSSNKEQKAYIQDEHIKFIEKLTKKQRHEEKINRQFTIQAGDPKG